MIDSHCHLAGEEFAADLPEVIDRAGAAGLAGALVILEAGNPEEGERAGRVRALWAGARFAVGIHPHRAGTRTEDLDRALTDLDRDLTDRSAVALGEIGLDYHYDFSPRAIQRDAFRRQLHLARARGLPVIIHTREAEEDTFTVLQEDGRDLRVVFHCFTGTRTMARRALDLGAWLSFAGIVTFPKAGELREVAKMVPADRCLVETDAPYLAPLPYRGRRNEPSYVARVVQAIAAERGEDPLTVAARTAANFEAVFGGGPVGTPPAR